MTTYLVTKSAHSCPDGLLDDLETARASLAGALRVGSHAFHHTDISCHCPCSWWDVDLEGIAGESEAPWPTMGRGRRERNGRWEEEDPWTAAVELERGEGLSGDAGVVEQGTWLS